MATETQAGELAGAKAPSVMMPVLMAAVLAVVLAMAVGGGGLWWMAKSGRLAALGGGHAPAAVVVVEPPAAHLVALDPVLVNLADTDGKSYLRVAMTLKVEDPPVKDKEAKPKEEAPAKGKKVFEQEAEVRDVTLTVLSRQTSEALLSPEGKEHLKTELREALRTGVPEIKITDVLFTDFLVQR